MPFLQNREVAMATQRTAIYQHMTVLQLIANVMMAISFCGLCMLGNKEIFTFWPGLVSFSAFINHKCKHTQLELNTRPPVYYNISLLRKALGQTITLSLFTWLDQHFKECDRLWLILTCVSVYLFLVFLMVIFKFGEDFDTAGGFLAAAFGSFHEAAKGIEVIELLLLTIVLSFLKNWLIGGAGILLPSDMRRRSTRYSEVVPVGQTTMQKLDRDLARFKTWFCTMNAILASMAFTTTAIGCYSFFVLVADENGMVSISDAVVTVCMFVWGCGVAYYCVMMRQPDSISTDGDSPYPNLCLVLKSIGQTTAIYVFTLLDDPLNAKAGVYSITLCACFFVNAVVAMTAFRVTEDWDVSAEFLSASFKLFYGVCREDTWDVMIVAGVSFIFAGFKNVVIGAKGLERDGL